MSASEEKGLRVTMDETKVVAAPRPRAPRVRRSMRKESGTGGKFFVSKEFDN